MFKVERGKHIIFPEASNYQKEAVHNHVEDKGGKLDTWVFVVPDADLDRDKEGRVE